MTNCARWLGSDWPTRSRDRVGIQLGDPEAAEEALDELSEIIERENSSFDNHHDLLIVRFLFDEAEEKINGS